MKKNGLLPLMIIVGSCLFIYLLVNSKKQTPLATLLPISAPLYQEENLEETDDPDKRLEYEISITKDPATGKVPVERLLKAAEFRDEKFLRQSIEGPNAAVPGISWTERGPSNIGGRTRALLYDLNGGPGFTKVWAGGVGGGLWVTNDISIATPVWTKVNDFFSNIAITTLAQNPVNNQIMYFGTGEGFFNADQIQGLGIWKTTDGGVNWAQLPSTNNINFGFIQKIIVAGNDTVIACTLDGIKRSVNGGTSWTTVLSNGVGGGSTIRAADVELASNGRMYATMGIFSRDGIYRSADSGATWTKIYASLVDEQRIEIASSPTNFDSLVALIQGTTNGIKKIMFSGDATAPVPTWTTVANPSWCDQGSASTDFTRTQAWYDLIAAFNPADGKSVIIGGVDLMRTNNSGTTFPQLSQWASGCAGLPVVHADIHAIVYKPGSSTEFLVGCDGGIYRTTNSGTAFTQRNSSYNVTQYYSAAISPTMTNYFIGGTQDNGSHRFTAAGINSVTTVTGGDGGFAHIDQNNHNLQFTSYTNNNINVSANGGLSFGLVTLGGGSFISPSDFDDISNVLYASNASGSFKRWNNPAGPNSPFFTVTCAAFGGNVSHISVSPSTANRVYFGTSNGKVVRVNDAHTGTSVTGTVLFTHPSLANISCITVDPGNENHMLVTASNYGVISIYESVNANSGSPTFQSVEGDLPDMPVRWVMFDPRNNDWALVATELGVWSTDNLNSGGVTDWEPTNTGFANTRIDMLQYRASDGTILAASHGRGMFTTVVPISKSIMFQDPGNSNSESSVTGTVDCRGYQDFVIPLIVTAAPVGNATVTISASGTAVVGADYDFTTNGNFVAPSNVLTFTSGSATPQNFTLRVYDDDAVESIENIVFTFAVTGATDAIKSNYNSNYVFALSDNDVNSFAAAPATNYTIGLNNSTTYMIGVNGLGNVLNNRGRVQFLYYASELQAAGMKPGLINSLQFTVAQKNSTAAYEGFTVSLGNTATTTLGSGFTASALTQVFNANFTTVLGANTIVCGSAFSWDGTSNLVVQFCHDNVAAMNSDFVNGTAFLTNFISQVSRAQTAAGAICTLAALNAYGSRMDMTFNSTTNGTAVETVVNSSKISNVVSGNNYNFYSGADNELLLSLNNPSSTLGCVTARIDAQGAVWQAYLGGERSQKVFEVTPTTGAGSNYNITVYFTTAELAGKAPASLRLVKTTAASASTATSANSVVVTPTTTDFGSYVSFSGSFTGFSRYFLITAAVTLPVTLTEFTGRLNNDSRSVLNWKTAAEYNTSEFVVERAIDGVHFEDIGSVRAKGNSNTTVSYALTDPYIAEKINYYRLRIIDIDGKFKYSEIVIIRNPLNKLKDIRVVNNPFRDYIELMFTELPDAKVELTLRDMNGKLYYRRSGVSVNRNHLQLDLSSINLSKGSYVLELISSSQRMSFKVIKQ